MRNSVLTFVVCFLAGAVYFIWVLITHKSKHKAKMQDIEDAFLTAMRRIANDELFDSRHISKLLAQSGFVYAELIRKSEVVFESLRIAKYSPNADTANSRIDLANQLWSEIKAALQNSTFATLGEELDAIFRVRLCLAHTGAVTSQVKKLLEKAAKLKTEKAQLRCIRQIEEILMSAEKNSMVHQASLEQLRNAIKASKATA